MGVDVQRVLDQFEDLRKKADVRSCFGKPVTAEGHTVIPVAAVTYAFGLGITEAEPAGEETKAPASAAEAEAGVEVTEETEETEEDLAGGGGMLVRPLAVIELTPEGTLVKPIVDEQKVTLAGALLIGWIALCLARTLVIIFGPGQVLGKPRENP
jgi:uncharacterized spore protein YtfJ